MPVIRELPVIDAPVQTFSTVLMGFPCDFALLYSDRANRWSFDLAVAGIAVLYGRRIVLGVDLVAPFNLGLGALVAVDWVGKGAAPGREELPSGQVRLLHVEPDPA